MEQKGKALVLALLGGKKPNGKDEPTQDSASEARQAAAEGVIEAITEKDAAALADALKAFFDACGGSKGDE